MKKLALLLMFAAPMAAAQEFATSFKSTDVAPGFYLLEGDGAFGGGNVTLFVGDEYVLLIDDAMLPTIAPLVEKASEIAGRPVDFVINTHAHGDHVGGNELLTGEGAVIVAHDNLRKRMLGNPDLDTGPGALPVLTFADSVTFHVNGQEAFVFHIEHAHTDGDAAIMFREANILVTGDVMFNKLFPFIDLENGGSVDGYIEGQRKLLAMANEQTRIVPGHGPVSNKAELQENLDVLVDSRNRVNALLEQGMSAEEIVAANPLADYHDTYNWGFITTERMTNTLISALTAE